MNKQKSTKINKKWVKRPKLGMTDKQSFLKKIQQKCFTSTDEVTSKSKNV